MYNRPPSNALEHTISAMVEVFFCKQSMSLGNISTLFVLDARTSSVAIDMTDMREVLRKYKWGTRNRVGIVNRGLQYN